MVISKRPPLYLSLIPVAFLILALAFNVIGVFGDDAVSGSNQVILILSGMLAGGLALTQGKKWDDIFDGISNNIKDTGKALLILLLIGSLSGSWLISGVIPAFIYYGLEILHPSYFLPASALIAAIISLATGSSWSTTATVGIALMGVGTALGFSAAMTAGAVISGAYFGDKMSPMSDTTNLAPAMAGTDLFTHIRYMALTTVPSISVALIVFAILGLTHDTSGVVTQTEAISNAVASRFNISPWLMIVPAVTIFMIIRKVDAVVAILIGTLLGGVVGLIAQPHILTEIAGATGLNVTSGYRAIMLAFYTEISLPSENEVVSELLVSKGMSGMIGTVWLVISAMVFGGAMEAAGFLQRIASALLSLAHSTAGLVITTLTTCGFLNVTASDQYLAIVVPGRMFKDVYRQRGLAPENLSRSLEDSGTVTSVLVPWNTCGAYQSSVLGVATGEYFIFAIFNWLSPFMSALFAIFGIRIAKLPEDSKTSPSA